VAESPVVQDKFCQAEHLPGGEIASAYPYLLKVHGSFNVIQCFTLSPNSLKQSSA